ncbi:MAG: hypothetical protein A3B62_07325 [Rhodospirillales bacterium RIFCSPLOWO2_01_FULL_65_14]|nr:MAG: hypothetical protein A3B62_07325 [Rhodospirillales bacterium RIFCSPLOWO2_01_FULL_65_14]
MFFTALQRQHPAGGQPIARLRRHRAQVTQAVRAPVKTHAGLAAYIERQPINLVAGDIRRVRNNAIERAAKRLCPASLDHVHPLRQAVPTHIGAGDAYCVP